jgi:hypothetical protein
MATTIRTRASERSARHGPTARRTLGSGERRRRGIAYARAHPPRAGRRGSTIPTRREPRTEEPSLIVRRRHPVRSERTRTTTLLLLVSALVTSACSSIPGLDDPDVGLEPFLTLYRFRGRTSMASVENGAVTRNPSQDLRTLGHTSRDEGFGGRIAIGDGFSGFEAHFLQVDNLTTKRGTLEANYGTLSTGDVVTTELNMIEVRAAYTGEVLGHEFELNDEPLTVRWGLGAALANRQIDLILHNVNGPDERNELRDNLVPYATTRLRFDHRNAGLQVDYGINPEYDFGNEFEGILSDVEVRLDYTFDVQGVTLFAAYRYAQLDGFDNADGLFFRNDFVVEGYTLGARISF